MFLLWVSRCYVGKGRRGYGAEETWRDRRQVWRLVPTSPMTKMSPPMSLSAMAGCSCRSNLAQRELSSFFLLSFFFFCLPEPEGYLPGLMPEMVSKAQEQDTWQKRLFREAQELAVCAQQSGAVRASSSGDSESSRAPTTSRENKRWRRTRVRG